MTAWGTAVPSTLPPTSMPLSTLPHSLLFQCSRPRRPLWATWMCWQQQLHSNCRRILWQWGCLCIQPSGGSGPEGSEKNLGPQVCRDLRCDGNGYDATCTRPPAPPARLPITNTSLWVKRFALMVAVITTTYPHKAPELFAYQASIIRAEKNHWVAYDWQFCRKAFTRNHLNWSVQNSQLYNKAFMGRAQGDIFCCSYCLQDDHTAASYPCNLDWPIFGRFPDPCTWSGGPASLWGPRPTQGRAVATKVCHRFNQGRCRFARCRFRHQCSNCRPPHVRVPCPSSSQSHPDT